MADIDIERKSSSGWLWALLGLVVLALILFWLLRGTDADRVTMVEDEPAAEVTPAAPTVEQPAATTAMTTPAELQQFQQTCGEPQPGQMGLDHQQTSECIRMLVGAMEASIGSNQITAVQPQIQTARDAAQRLAASPADTTSHSSTVREAFTSVAAALDNVQGQAHPELEGAVQDLNQTAESIEDAEPLLSQRDNVERFFQQAGNILNRMVTAPTV